MKKSSIDVKREFLDSLESCDIEFITIKTRSGLEVKLPVDAIHSIKSIANLIKTDLYKFEKI